jgi:putative addiction module component (TIGR02574 family)
MSITAEKILEGAMQLTSGERIQVVESLLKSLDKPDPEIDALWKKEVEERIAAAGSGEMKILDEEEVFEK